MSQKNRPVVTLATSAFPARSRVEFGEKWLVGGLSALLIARCLVGNDDPGRLRLVSGAGPLTLNLLSFALLFGWAIVRGLTRRPLTTDFAVVVPVGLFLVSAAIFGSAAGPDRYQHPGWYIGWDWLSMAVLCFLVCQLATSPAVCRGLIALMLATAASIAAQALFQALVPLDSPYSADADAGLTQFTALVGDDEFGSQIDRASASRGKARGTFPQAETFGCFLLLLMPSVLVWALHAWRSLGQGRNAAIVCCLIGASAIAAVSSISRAPQTRIASLIELIGQKPFFGVGPGNLTRIIGPAETITAAFWPSLAASAGLIACGLALAILIAAIVKIFRALPCEHEKIAVPPHRGPRWEFYGGGLVGLLLGMVLAIGDVPPEASESAIIRVGAMSAGRAFVWFIAFALFEHVLVGERAARMALATGVILVAISGFASDALSSPAVLQSLWVALILSLPRPQPPSSVMISCSPWRWIGAPIAVALFVGNLVHVGLPGLSTAAAARSARTASAAYPYSDWQIVGKTGEERLKAIADAQAFLEHNILDDLRFALKNDRDNSALLLEVARWSRRDWLYRLNLQQKQSAKREALDMLGLAELAARLDPHNPSATMSVYESLLLFTGTNTTASREQLAALDKYIRLIAERSPDREVELRFRVAMALLHKRNAETIDAWSVELLRLEAVDGAPHGRLREEQRSQLFDGLRKTLTTPSAELTEFLATKKS